MLPDGLKKPAPEMTTAWPTPPDEGCRLVRTGAPPGPVGGLVVDVVLVVVVEAVGASAGAVLVGAFVVEGADGAGRVTPVDDRWPPEGPGDGPPPASTEPRRAARTTTMAADTMAIARRRPRSRSGGRAAAWRWRMTGGGGAPTVPAVDP
jgi:hypothetical protein